MKDQSLVQFLADESCDVAVIRALRDDGNDVFALSEVMRRSIDREVIGRSTHERRVLLTEDKDFGWLVFVSGAESAGVILMRFPGGTRGGLVDAVRRLVREHGAALAGAFVVVQPGAVRISRGPSARS